MYQILIISQCGASGSSTIANFGDDYAAAEKAFLVMTSRKSAYSFTVIKLY